MSLNLQTITQFFLVKKQIIIFTIWIFITCLLALLITGYFVDSFRQYWYDFGKKSGSLSIIFFTLSSTPGILKRFKVTGLLQKIQIILMAYRRQLGVCMYLFALTHYCLIKLFPALITNGQLLPSTTYEVAGSIAFMLTLPLFLTSNDYAQRILGKYWKKLHSLVYLIMWIIFAHLFLLGRIESITILIFVLAVLEIISWIIFWINQSKQSAPSSQTRINPTDQGRESQASSNDLSS